MKMFYCLFFFISCTLVFSQPIPDKWLTYYEKSGGTKTPRYAETMEYCRMLQKNSPWIKVTSFGKSPEGRDLPLVIASKEKAFDPASAMKTKKTVILIQNGIHSGEIDGKDACLMLLRDIALTKTKSSLLDHVILLIIPIYNVDGHERFGKYNRINQNGPEEMGWRVTGQNLNLNRDYVKADAPETQAWLKLYTSWFPDFFIDCHVTDGADFQYPITYAIEIHENAPVSVRDWVKRKFIPAITSKMKETKHKIGPYPFFVDDKDKLKGLTGGTTPPRFSTGYTVLQNRPGLLIETHMMKDYATRVDATYQLLRSILEMINDDPASLLSAVNEADKQSANNLENPFPIGFETTNNASDTVHFFGYKQTIEKSDVSGADRIIYSKEPFEADIPIFNEAKVTKTVTVPYAYLIPQQWSTVISRLLLHGIKLEQLTSPAELDVSLYRFSNSKWQQTPFEGRHTVSYSVEAVQEKRTYPAGTVVARLNQRAARVLINALEPEASDAFAAWGFFDAVFEQKEYSEDYVMEVMAREMMKSDPALKSEFESKLQSDSVFAKSPNARLNFFYQHSPYWDHQMNLYPVARIEHEINLPTHPFHLSKE